MKLFKYENWKVVISPEIYALKPFRKIWNRDKSASKDHAIMELGYIYFMLDARSDYQYILDEKERSQTIIEQEGIGKGWKPDATVKEAMKLYESFIPASATLLARTRNAIDKLGKAIENIDINERDDKGKPVWAISTVTSAIKQIPQLIKELAETEKQVNSDMSNEGRMRGNAEKTVYEDSLDD